MKYFYITTPIYYVNDKPHIGHAYTSIAADIFARFYRLRGYNVKFLTGTDEHGLKIERSAEAANTNPIEFCNKISANFKNLSKILNLSNDDFIRTTEQRHIDSATKLWNQLFLKEEIYLGEYKGWYNISDEAFVSENEVIEGGFSKDGKKLELLEEKSYFFKLSSWQDRLLDFYEKNPTFIQPKSKFNEVVSFVKSGLRDLSISRSSFKWGIKIPQDKTHIMYVWIDALANYLSAIHYGEDNLNTDLWDNCCHIIGKDILKFHAVYWPAILMAAGINPPKSIFAHGWWTNNGQKISKSLGNTIDPIQLIEKYGADELRYYLFREINFGSDGDFSEKSLQQRINTDLCNDLGNLLQRTIILATKHLGHSIKTNENYINIDNQFILDCSNLFQLSEEHMLNKSPFKALEAIFITINNANRYIEQNKPWELAKNNPERFATVISVLLAFFQKLGIYLFPFMPNTSNKIYKNLGLNEIIFTNTRLSVYNIPAPELLFKKTEE